MFNWNTTTFAAAARQSLRAQNLHLQPQMHLPVCPWPVSAAEPGPSRSRGSCACTLGNLCHRGENTAGSLGTQKGFHLIQK